MSNYFILLVESMLNPDYTSNRNVQHTSRDATGWVAKKCMRIYFFGQGRSRIGKFHEDLRNSFISLFRELLLVAGIDNGLLSLHIEYLKFKVSAKALESSKQIHVSILLITNIGFAIRLS